MHRTPPKSPKTPGPGQSQSVPDIASASRCEDSNVNVTNRGKRPRIDDSPSNPEVNSSCTCSEWKCELMQLLNTWRIEYDRKLSTWKAEFDAMLSALVQDVAEIKNQCVSIQKSTIGLEGRSASRVVRTKGKHQDGRHDGMQDFDKNQATSQLSNAPPNDDAGMLEDPIAIASKGGKSVDRDIPKTNPRDTNRPGKPAVTATRQAPKPRVVLSELPLPAVAAEDNMSGTNKDEQSRDGWTEVRHRRSHRSLGNILRGTAAPGTTNLEASERWRYLHLFYVKQGTSDSQVRDHLLTICGTDVCTVEVLKPRGKYASFKLGVPSKLADLVMAAQNWAEDICVKPWRRNFRGQGNDTQKSP